MHVLQRPRILNLRGILALVAALVAIAVIISSLNSVVVTTGSSIETAATSQWVVPTLDNGPVPGMPRATFEELVSTTLGPPAGMPQSVWEQISG